MQNSKYSRWIYAFGFLAIAVLVAGLIALVPFSGLVSTDPALAAPNRQIPIYTPTPLPDGRIIYTVKENDTLLSISLITGVSVDDLRTLNDLSGDIIVPGQKLLLGRTGPPQTTPTLGPSPTPTPVLPTPTPKPGTADLCVLLYHDLNGDSIRQEDEPAIPDGAISLSNRSGTVSETADTLPGLDPYCFEGVPEGDYNVTVAVPEGYNPTTVTNFAITLEAGRVDYLNFGAQPNMETIAEAPAPSEGGRSPVLGILGGLLLLVGVGLALFAGRLLKG
ncbi:MAG: LysM peptidoglycan-binding domain-containing protein [Anaerolineales bacterium]|jgi:LysM repeat protein